MLLGLFSTCSLSLQAHICFLNTCGLKQHISLLSYYWAFGRKKSLSLHEILEMMLVDMDSSLHCNNIWVHKRRNWKQEINYEKYVDRSVLNMINLWILWMHLLIKQMLNNLLYIMSSLFLFSPLVVTEI